MANRPTFFNGLTAQADNTNAALQDWLNQWVLDNMPTVSPYVAPTNNLPTIDHLTGSPNTPTSGTTQQPTTSPGVLPSIITQQPQQPSGDLQTITSADGSAQFNIDPNDLSNISYNLDITPGTFADLDAANKYGYNQAKGIYDKNLTVMDFDPVTFEAQQKVYDIARGQNPYITGALNSSLSQLTESNPIYSSMGNLALQQNPNNFNAFTSATNPYTTRIGHPTNNPYISSMANTGSNPYTGQVANSFNYNAYQNSVTNTGNNPYMQSFANKSNITNPYGNAIGQGYQDNSVADNLNYNQSNPFLQGFMGFSGMQDSRLDAVVDKALGKVSDRVNSQFGLAGRTGSGAHQQLMTEGLGDVANQMYSDNFQQNANRALQALQSGAGAYDSLQGRNLQSLGMGIDAFNTDQNRQLDYLSQAGQFANQDFGNQMTALGSASDAYNTDAARRLQGAGMGADIYAQDQDRRLDTLLNAGQLSNIDADRRLQGFGMASDAFATQDQRNLNALINAGNFAGDDLNRQMTATGLSSDLWQQGFNNDMNVYNAQSDMFNTDQDRFSSVAQSLPDMANSRYNDAFMLQDLGSQRDLIRQQIANQPWDNLQRFMNIVGGATEQPALPSQRVSSIDRAMGLLPLLSVFS